MSRATIAAWHCRPSADWSAPERQSTVLGGADRWLAALAGRVALVLDGAERRRLRRFAAQATRQCAPLTQLDAAALVERSAALRHALLHQGLTDALAAQAFALASEACHRLIGKRPYPVQLMGGFGLLRGRMIEMATGEGKTLTAVLPCLTLALAGVPVHVITVNDYLARRDAAQVRPVFALFGLSVGVVTHLESDEAKRQAYGCDVVYCVNKDLVFDYLRDTLKRRPTSDVAEPGAQRGLYFALVDEADSVLVDEARTPLIIARERANAQQRADAEFALELARTLAPEHFKAEQQGRQFRLTPAGQSFLKDRVARLEQATALWRITRIREERVEQALCALRAYARGAQYVIQDDKIQIVDEFTGRILPDRTWERGLHQMIEVKEGLDTTAPRETIARLTYPEFFARYMQIGGMTGTGSEVAGEIRANFGMQTVRIPTNRPRIRRDLGVRLFARSDARWNAIAARAMALAGAGRAVLIGTRSVAASEELSRVLDALAQPHRVLNALQDDAEAEIIAMAGQSGRITVATNMAGRGTDIDLKPQVRAAGGLHVILSEFHESRRIDRQLSGRCGRQGDPGSCEAMVSLQDELFLQFSPWLASTLSQRYQGQAELPGSWGRVLRFVAQLRAESRNLQIRRQASARGTEMRRVTAFSGAQE